MIQTPNNSLLKQAATALRSWHTRRVNKGRAITADELWKRIQRNWGFLPEEQQESLFQII